MIDHHDEIDRLFAGETVEAIVAALDADGSEWALAQAADPADQVAAQHEGRRCGNCGPGGRMTDFADDMVMEMRIGARVVMSHDFTEGVRAVIVDKDNAPRWAPATLEGVTDAMLDDIFAPLPADQEWTPL